MADDDQPLSKRERQKQRRASKREAQQVAARRQRIRKTAATVVVAVVALVAIGFAGFMWQRSPAEESAVFAGESEAAQAAGCRAVTQPPNLGADHFGGQAAELESSPPSEIYDHRPATSGSHLPVVAATGAYDRHVDERLLLHNLEHGYVVAWYSPELGEQQRGALLEWGRSAVEDEPHLIVAQYPEPLPDGGQIAYVAWGQRQLCDDFSAEVAGAFLDRFANAEGPEPGAGPHDGTGQGELIPGEQRVVFPPFDAPSDGSGGPDAQGSDGADGGSDEPEGAAGS